MAEIRTAVIGGGITGLAATYFLDQAQAEIGEPVSATLFEATTRLGGLIRTVREEGFLLEGGPEGWASYKPSAKKLAIALGLQNALAGSQDQFRKTLIVRNGRLTTLPDGMMFLAPIDPLAFWRTAPLSLAGKLRASLEPLISKSQGDLSVRQFFERRLGREFTEKLVDPMISSIFGGDFETLSARSSLPELYRCEQRTGSLWKGLRPFARLSLTMSVLFTMQEGMEQLTQALAARLPAEVVQTEATAIRIRPAGKGFSVGSRGNEEFFDFVILATPAPSTADLIEAFAAQSAARLRQIPYGSSALIYLGYSRAEFSHPLDGFGFVVPRGENLKTSACTWVSTKFAGRSPDDRVLLRCAIHSANGTVQQSDAQLSEQVQEEVSRLLGLSCQPVYRRIFRVNGALPQLLVGHQARLQLLQQDLAAFPGLLLAGSFAGGVGIPDCVKTAEQSVIRIKQLITGSADLALDSPAR